MKQDVFGTILALIILSGLLFFVLFFQGEGLI